MFSKVGNYMARGRVTRSLGLNTVSQMGFKTTQVAQAKKLSIGEAVNVLESKIADIS